MRRPSTARLRAALGITVVTLASAGCGATVEPAATPDGAAPRQVTVVNCGREVTYDKVPEQAVVYDVGMSEMMFSLGLAPRTRGWVANKVYGGIETSAYRADFDRVDRLGDSRISLEIVLNAKADWVFAGNNQGFVESRGITPAILATHGVASYVLTETCANTADSAGAMAPVDGVYTDYRNLGRIFDVADRAEQTIADMRRRLAAASAGKPATPARVLVSDVYEDKPYVAGAASIATAIVEQAGGRSVTDDITRTWDSVGWETVVAADPEVIVIVDYGVPYEEKKKALMNTPSMRNVTAVREGRIFRLEFADVMAGPRVATSAEKLAAYLRSVGK
ncbi:iron transporter [Micromonospora fluostatini]|uniref:Iron transporter n=1 Tax=Micromonospora fluostatini TaxID=1629071 RepID=A0ABY2DJ37_9ACTN|nr:iron transporter [Micromonospora fluostatini]